MEELEKELGFKKAVDYSKLLIPQGVGFPKPESVFNIGATPIFTKKSISLGIAKAKAGKTTVTAWMVAQMLKENLRVIWLDTEQGTYYGSRTQAWILSIAFMDNCDSLKYFDLRVLSPTERIEAINQILYTYSADVVVVDGARDLLYDVNSPEQATNVATEAMRWAQEYNCHLINILHENKNDGNAKGHLGAELTNKSETVFKVETDEANQIIVSSAFSRAAPFASFALGRSETGIPYLLNDWTSTVSEKPNKRKLKAPGQIDDAIHLLVLTNVFSVDEKMNATNFYAQFIISYNTVAEIENDRMTGNRALSFLKFYIAQKYIIVEKGARNNEVVHSLNTQKALENL